MKLDIRSHTDSRASHAYNEKLSDRRAKSTVQYIISIHIPIILSFLQQKSNQKLTLSSSGFSHTSSVWSRNLPYTLDLQAMPVVIPS